ncbi:GNAT family N-acetyltransferase [Adhaeribacter radiodurans]|uniref:GNAT family N-acetyltransferase n=1 Tax=Adhaeribacter radiodurans TaxID=2745197 RepID=A0A7L7L5D0_9BACT|nr:GNAT family N-acetyltransferase [Adhaeribacter radiodurans]QMU28006.1 GNAT family N-acetyltransferase [Adhaeribacter radiodurans]
MSAATSAKSNNTIIRTAFNPDDIPVIATLAEQTWAPTYQNILSAEQLNFMFQEIYNPEALKQQMEAGQQFLLLFQDQAPAGFASYSALPDNSFKLNKLYVSPAFHGYGLGRLLINAVEEAVKHVSGTTLLLNVNRNNPARSFYEKCGYTIAYEEDIPIGPYFMNDYVMQKKLAVT